MNFITHAIVVALMLIAGLAGGGNLVEQALNENTNLTLERVTVRQALDRLLAETGVRIVMSPDTEAMLPQGRATVLEKITFPSIPLREGITELLDKLGMTFVVQEDHLVVIPKESILCLGRPPTWTELDTLAQLTAMKPGTDDSALAQLQLYVQFQLPVQHPWEQLAQAVRETGAGPGDEVLSIACHRLGWAWCVSDTRIVITSVVQLIQRQLQRPVDLRENNRPLIDILQTLSNQARVPIRVEPGALASLSPQVSGNFSINASSASVEQVLEKIQANTGLGYLINTEGVLFYRLGIKESDPAPTAASANQKGSDPFVGKVVVPLADGTTLEWLIRMSELPLDLRERRAEDLQKAFDAIREKSAAATP